jgi:hypothetical protein
VNLIDLPASWLPICAGDSAGPFVTPASRITPARFTDVELVAFLKTSPLYSSDASSFVTTIVNCVDTDALPSETGTVITYVPAGTIIRPETVQTRVLGRV